MRQIGLAVSRSSRRSSHPLTRLQPSSRRDGHLSEPPVDETSTESAGAPRTARTRAFRQRHGSRQPAVRRSAVVARNRNALDSRRR